MINNFLLEIITEDLPYKNSFIFAISLVKNFISQINYQKYLYNKINWFFTHRRIVLKIYDLYKINTNIREKNYKNYLQIISLFKINLQNFLIKTIQQCCFNQNSILIYDDENYKINFIRQIKNIIFLLNNKLIKISFLNLKSTKNTLGHIFIKKNCNIKINNIDNYENSLYTLGNVIINYQYRKFFLLQQIKKLELLYNIHIDYVSLLDELIFYKEWPILIKSHFHKKFLHLPNEIIIYIIKNKHKSFVVYDKSHKLLNIFFTVINVNLNYFNENQIKLNLTQIINNLFTEIDFFYFNDRKMKICDLLQKIKSIYYEDKLGSIYDKTKRIKYLLIELSKFLNINKKIAIKLSIISKCDLATLLVQEYPYLRGITVKNYSKLSYALQEQPYKCNNYSSILILSDNLDDLVGLISLHFRNKKISLEQDPYEIRRKTIHLIEIILKNNINIDLLHVINYCKHLYKKNYFLTINSYTILNFIYLKYINFIKKYQFNSLIIKSTRNFFYLYNNIFLLHQKIQFLHTHIHSIYFNKIIEIYKRTNNIFNKINKHQLTTFKHQLTNDNLEIAMWQVIIICNYFCNKNIIFNYNYGNHIIYYLYKLSTYMEYFLNKRKILSNNNIYIQNRILISLYVKKLLLKLTDINIIINK